MLDKNAMGYWKYGSLIVLLIFCFTLFALILAILNLNPDGTFFVNNLQPLIMQKRWGTITSIMGIIAGYLYFLFYIEQHRAFVLKEKTKEAKITIGLFMLFRIINYVALVLVIYLILVPKVYLYAGIVAGALVITEVVFKSIIKYFNNILSDYRTLEALEPAKITSTLQKLMTQNRSDIKDVWSKVKNRDRSQSFVKTLLLPYVGYMPAFIYGTVRIMIIKKGGTHVKNSIILLTFLTIFVMLPAGLDAINGIVIAYIELTLLYWFWISSIVFSGLPEYKVNVKLKDGKLYDKVYCIEDNPGGYRLYLNSDNVVLRVDNSKLEEEIPIKGIDLTFIKDLEKRMLDEFTYLPIYCIENFNLNMEYVDSELKNPKKVTWHSEDVLEAVLKSGIERMPEKEEVSKLIDQFAYEFNDITIRLYKNYEIAYKKLEELTKFGKTSDKTLMLGLYNKLLNCDRTLWPNIYNKIQESNDLSKKYNLLVDQLNDITELQDYKKLVEKAQEMKKEYENKLEKIAS